MALTIAPTLTIVVALTIVATLIVVETKGKSCAKGEKIPWVPWLQKDFEMPKLYWLDVCKLPCVGLNPRAISSDLIFDQDLEACFGEYNKNGAKLGASKIIPVDDIVQLTQVLDGFDNPLNNMLGKNLTKALYAHFVLRRLVSWASFVEQKPRTRS